MEGRFENNHDHDYDDYDYHSEELDEPPFDDEDDVEPRPLPPRFARLAQEESQQAQFTSTPQPPESNPFNDPSSSPQTINAPISPFQVPPEITVSQQQFSQDHLPLLSQIHPQSEQPGAHNNWTAVAPSDIPQEEPIQHDKVHFGKNSVSSSTSTGYGDPFSLEGYSKVDSKSHIATNSPFIETQDVKKQNVQGLVQGENKTFVDKNAVPFNENRNTAEKLPTYAELAQAEPVRFRRWRGWIDKRAIETRELRQQERQNRRQRGWNLEETGSEDAMATSTEERNHFSRLRVSNTSRQPSFTPSVANFHRSENSSSLADESSDNALPGLIPLTISSTGFSVGPRFISFPFESEPTCATFLPGGVISTSIRHQRAKSTDSKRLPEHRFALIGSREGLWLLDFYPDVLRRNVDSAESVGNAKVYEIWNGKGVYQIDICKNDAEQSKPKRGRARRNAVSSSGVVIMIVSSGPNEEDGKSVQLWPLQAILNLVKWRTLTPSSQPLNLNSLSRSRHSRSVSALTTFRRFFGDSSSTAVPPSPNTDPTKPRSPVEPQRSSLDSVQSADRADFPSSELSNNPQSRLKRSNTTKGRRKPPMHSHSHSHSSTDNPPNEQGPLPQSTDPLLAQPIEWATTAVPVTLGKDNAPILFFELAYLEDQEGEAAAKRTFESPDMTIGSQRGSRLNSNNSNPFATPVPSVSRSSSHSSLSPSSSSSSNAESSSAPKSSSTCAYLIIATKNAVHVFQRSGKAFKYISDYYVPVPPTFVRLLEEKQASELRSNQFSSHASWVGMSNYTVAKQSSSTLLQQSDNSADPPRRSLSERLSKPHSNLSLFLSLRGKKRGVLISLADASVMEVSVADSDVTGHTLNPSSRSAGGMFSEMWRSLNKSTSTSASVRSLDTSALALVKEPSHHRLLNKLQDSGKDGGSDASPSTWKGFCKLNLPCSATLRKQRLSPSNRHGAMNATVPIFFVTKGSNTHIFLHGSFSDSRGEKTSTHSSRHRGGGGSSNASSSESKRGSGRGRTTSMGESQQYDPSHLYPEPFYTFKWVASPRHVVVLCPRPSSRSNENAEDVPETAEGNGHDESDTMLTLVLVAYAPAGLEVKEVFVDVSAVETAYNNLHVPNKAFKDPNKPLFIMKESVPRNLGADARKGKQRGNEDEDDELHGTAVYEIGSEVGFLCEEMRPWETVSSKRSRHSSRRTQHRPTRPSGSLWWVRQFNEWRIMWLGCSEYGC